MNDCNLIIKVSFLLRCLIVISHSHKTFLTWVSTCFSKIVIIILFVCVCVVFFFASDRTWYSTFWIWHSWPGSVDTMAVPRCKVKLQHFETSIFGGGFFFTLSNENCTYVRNHCSTLWFWVVGGLESFALLLFCTLQTINREKKGRENAATCKLSLNST